MIEVYNVGEHFLIVSVQELVLVSGGGFLLRGRNKVAGGPPHLECMFQRPVALLSALFPHSHALRTE